MAIITLLAILGLFGTVYASECKTPSPINNLNAKDFSGSWYIVGLETLDEGEKKYDNSRCGKLLLNLDNGEDKENKWQSSIMTGKTKVDLSGTYTIPDPKQGTFKMNYVLRNLTYDMTVPCTDYKTYAIAYVCLKIDSDILSGFSLLFAREKTAYDELIAKDEIKNCLKGVARTQLNSIGKVSFNDCPADI